MQIVKTKNECDHVQFLITDASGPGVVTNPMIAELETLSVGESSFILIKRYKSFDDKIVIAID